MAYCLLGEGSTLSAAGSVSGFPPAMVGQADASVAISTGHSGAAGQTRESACIVSSLLGAAVAKQSTQPVGLSWRRGAPEGMEG